MPRKPKLLFFSSAWGNEALFQDITKALESEFDIDFPSIHNFDTISGMAEHVLSIYEGQEISGVIGISMGGFIVQEILIKTPSFAKRAVILASFAKRHPLEAEAFMKDLMQKVKAGQLEKLADLFADIMLAPEYKNNPHLHSIVRSMPIDLGEEICLNHHHACIHWRDHSDQLQNITTPTLIVAGAQDQAVPSGFVEDLALDLPNAKFVKIEHAGHAIPLEQPYDVTNMMLGWLRSK